MLEINYMVLDDMLHDMADTPELEAFQKSLTYYIRTDKRLQKVLYPTGYGRGWQNALLENPEDIKAQLGHDIDKAFTNLTILRKVYKNKTNARLYDGVIGKSRRECTEAEWISFRQDKADVLDQIISYLMVSGSKVQ